MPILTRCDSISEIKLTLACTWDLWLSYSKRNNISQDEIKELISSKIMNEDVMYDICFYYQIDIMRTVIAHRDILQTLVGKEQSWQNLKVRDV